MKSVHRLSLLPLAAALAAGVACASTSGTGRFAAGDGARYAAASANAGEAKESVRFLRPIHGYEVVGPRALLVWETPFRAWLVDLREGDACRHLERSVRLKVETFSDTLNSRNGYVDGDGGLYCRIDRIREVDVPAMRAAMRGEPDAR